MDLYLASNNPKKLRELNDFLAHMDIPNISVLSATEVGGMPEVDETEDSFRGNAILKAQALLEKVPEEAWVLADDSGILVDSLGGAPGLYSKRYSGPNATDEHNVEKILNRLEGFPVDERRGRFVCLIVLMNRAGDCHSFWGVSEGHIAFEPEGTEGFGYDPVFIPEGYERSFSILGEAVRFEIGHRGRALQALGDFLTKQ